MKLNYNRQLLLSVALILLGNVLEWGLPGYWWGHAIAGYVSVILGLVYFLMGTWKKRGTLLQKTA